MSKILQRPVVLSQSIILALFSSILLLISSFDAGLPEHSLASTPLAISVPFLIFVLFMRAENSLKKYRLVMIISTASFFMYLLHRPIYKTITYFYLPESVEGQLFYLWAMCLPLVVVISYFGQKIYDIVTWRISQVQQLPVTLPRT